MLVFDSHLSDGAGEGAHTLQGAFWRLINKILGGCCFDTMQASTVIPGRGYLSGFTFVKGLLTGMHRHAGMWINLETRKGTAHL